MAVYNIIGFYASPAAAHHSAYKARQRRRRGHTGVGATLGAIEILTAYFIAAVLVVVFVPVSAVIRRKRPDFRQSVPLLPFLLCGCAGAFVAEAVFAFAQ